MFIWVWVLEVAKNNILSACYTPSGHHGSKVIIVLNNHTQKTNRKKSHFLIHFSKCSFVLSDKTVWVGYVFFVNIFSWWIIFSKHTFVCPHFACLTKLAFCTKMPQRWLQNKWIIPIRLSTRERCHLGRKRGRRGGGEAGERGWGAGEGGEEGERWTGEGEEAGEGNTKTEWAEP